MLHDLDLYPLSTAEVRRFLSVWTSCEPSDLGLRYKELQRDLENAISPYLGRVLNAALEQSVRSSILAAVRRFEERHADIRITKSELAVRLGNFNVELSIERSGLPVKTFRSLPLALQKALSPSGRGVQIGGP